MKDVIIVIDLLEGIVVGSTQAAAVQNSFTNFDHLTDGTLVAGSPDRYYGAHPAQLNREIRKKLSGSIEPSTGDRLPLLPNCFLKRRTLTGTHQ
ncbi:hypothetical protein F5B21DRAFT_458423 [Xylaria acuta]|nr:hypothetical protein F5B21DRAFT_458423 [Xylaria acuta]